MKLILSLPLAILFLGVPLFAQSPTPPVDTPDQVAQQDLQKGIEKTQTEQLRKRVKAKRAEIKALRQELKDSKGNQAGKRATKGERQARGERQDKSNGERRDALREGTGQRGQRPRGLTERQRPTEEKRTQLRTQIRERFSERREQRQPLTDSKRQARRQNGLRRLKDSSQRGQRGESKRQTRNQRSERSERAERPAARKRLKQRQGPRRGRRQERQSDRRFQPEQ